MSRSGLGRRAWSLEGARLVLADVRARTQRAVERIDQLDGPTRGEGAGSGEEAEAVQRVLSGWVREMEALGVEVRGAWRVDFDCGSGYYCWRWPEAELLYFYGYDDGFEGRVRIQ